MRTGEPAGPQGLASRISPMHPAPAVGSAGAQTRHDDARRLRCSDVVCRWWSWLLAMLAPGVPVAAAQSGSQRGGGAPVLARGPPEPGWTFGHRDRARWRGFRQLDVLHPHRDAAVVAVSGWSSASNRVPRTSSWASRTPFTADTSWSPLGGVTSSRKCWSARGARCASASARTARTVRSRARPLRLYDLIDQQGNTAALREHGRVAAAGAPEADTLLTIFRRPEAKGHHRPRPGRQRRDTVSGRSWPGWSASAEYFLIGGVARCDAPWSKP